jgi:hypothetical protein
MDLYLSSLSGVSKLASFQFIASVYKTPTEGLVGAYFWDGQTFPKDVTNNMNAAYGGVSTTTGHILITSSTRESQPARITCIVDRD